MIFAFVKMLLKFRLFFKQIMEIIRQIRVTNNELENVNGSFQFGKEISPGMQY